MLCEAGFLISTLQVWNIRARAAKSLPSSLCGRAEQSQSCSPGQPHLIMRSSTPPQHTWLGSLLVPQCTHPISAPLCSLCCAPSLCCFISCNIPLLMSFLYVSLESTEGSKEDIAYPFCQYSPSGPSCCIDTGHFNSGPQCISRHLNHRDGEDIA